VELLALHGVRASYRATLPNAPTSSGCFFVADLMTSPCAKGRWLVSRAQNGVKAQPYNKYNLFENISKNVLDMINKQ
jgi:hypothetical protein